MIATGNLRRALGGLACLAGVIVLTGAPAAAHPLGNFSINHATALRVGTNAVQADFVADLAEVPSVAALARIDANRDKTYAPAERERYAATTCQAHLPRLMLALDGVRAGLRVVGTTVFLLPGEAGLTTVRLECRLTTGPVRTLGRTVTFTDGADPGRPGWREVTATGSTARLTRSTVPDRSPTTALTRYPADRLEQPLQVTRAELDVAATPAATPAAPVDATPAPVAGGGALNGLVGAPRGLVATVVAALLAAVLGAGHALTPGHGKTLMMLSLTGQRASWPEALLIGGSVTLSHTLGVILLAALVTLSAVAAPEAVFGWLGVAHGALIAGIGAVLVVRRRRRRAEPHHHHHHHHQPLPRSGLVGLGLAGGLVPSPSALLVLVGAHALGRPAYGVALVVAYGLGMAGCLTVTGIVLARGGQRIAAGVGARHPALRGLPGLLPVVASWLVVASGVFLALRGLAVVAA